jgi:hypothetical protein
MSAQMSEGSVVHMRREVGVIQRVLAHGYAYRVQTTNGETYVCLGSVLKPAAQNVAVFPVPRKDAAP